MRCSWWSRQQVRRTDEVMSHRCAGITPWAPGGQVRNGKHMWKTNTHRGSTVFIWRVHYIRGHLKPGNGEKVEYKILQQRVCTAVENSTTSNAEEKNIFSKEHSQFSHVAFSCFIQNHRTYRERCILQCRMAGSVPDYLIFSLRSVLQCSTVKTNIQLHGPHMNRQTHTTQSHA